LIFLYFTLPRKASNSDAPPMVKSSIKIPLIGQIIEFGMSPVKMVFRCYAEYGPVFTVPVSFPSLLFIVSALIEVQSISVHASSQCVIYLSIYLLAYINYVI
jgi:hypothetical protein